jgi:hypothetical protein
MKENVIVWDLETVPDLDDGLLTASEVAQLRHGAVVRSYTRAVFLKEIERLMRALLAFGICLWMCSSALACRLDSMVGWTLIARKTVDGRRQGRA